MFTKKKVKKKHRQINNYTQKKKKINKQIKSIFKNFNSFFSFTNNKQIIKINSNNNKNKNNKDKNKNKNNKHKYSFKFEISRRKLGGLNKLKNKSRKNKSL